MKGLATTLALIWRLAIPYFRSDDRWPGRLLLVTVVAIEFAVVAITVLINKWNNQFYNALQDRNWNVFVYQLGYFCVLAGAFVLLRVYQLYLNQWLQIRWRRWLTAHYLERWLDAANHYRMQMRGDAADNPDQRIAEDIQLFIDRTLRLGLGLLNSVVTLASFVVILWGLSAAAPLTLFGAAWAIPGYLVWSALVYAVVGTALTHWIGRPLIGLNFDQQRFEADFRFNLVRVRENAEQIALLAGEAAERQRLLGRFGKVVQNWLAIMSRTKKLTFLTAGYDQIAIIFPYVVVSPAYFAGKMQLGGLMQTASAFSSVQSSLSFFVLAYAQLAEWRAVIARLSGFEQAIEAAQGAAATAPTLQVEPRGETKSIRIEDLMARLPNGVPLVTATDLVLPAGERVLVTGPSGAGKSTFFRAIAGIWPYGAGTVAVPHGARIMILPQRPYFPVASLASAIAYPGEPETFGTDRIVEVLTAVGLGALVPRLAEEAHWNRMLSLGEQQRLAIARALLHAPDYLFLDEATASLDEPAEAALYRLMEQRLAAATIVSIGHRSTLAAFHDRRWTLAREGDRHSVRDTALDRAAE